MGSLAVVEGLGCGRGYRSLGAGVGTGPGEGNPGVRRRVGCSLVVVVGRIDLDAEGGTLLVAEAGIVAVEDSRLVLGEDLRRTVGSGCSRRRRRLRSNRCLTFCCLGC